MSDFFGFRKMVTPGVVKVVYIVGLVILTVGGIAAMTPALGSRMGLSAGQAIAYGIVMLTLGNLGWRIISEQIILLFRIHEVLESIDTGMSLLNRSGQGQKAPGGSPGPLP